MSTGYISDTTAGSWFCKECGKYIPSGQYHVHNKKLWATGDYFQPVGTQERIAAALERIADALEKMNL